MPALLEHGQQWINSNKQLTQPIFNYIYWSHEQSSPEKQAHF